MSQNSTNNPTSVVQRLAQEDRYTKSRLERLESGLQAFAREQFTDLEALGFACRSAGFDVENDDAELRIGVHARQLAQPYAADYGVHTKVVLSRSGDRLRIAHLVDGEQQNAEEVLPQNLLELAALLRGRLKVVLDAAWPELVAAP